MSGSFFNNGIIICYQYSLKVTVNNNFVFPIMFTEKPALVGVGFVVESICEQYINNLSISGFSTSSNIHNCGTCSYLAIGS